MAKKKKTATPLVKAQGTCEISQHLADRLWQEGIAVPKGMTLRYTYIDSRKGRMTADHPLCRFYGSSAIWWETVDRARGEYATADDRAKANIDALSTRELRDFVNGARSSIRNFTDIARLDFLFRLSDAYEVMPSDMVFAIEHDEAGNPRVPIGFDSVFLNLAGERGVSQADIETAMWVEAKRLKARHNAVCGQPVTGYTPRSEVINVVRQGFSNRTVEQLRATFGSNYRNMNTLYDPVFQRLAPFNACIHGTKPLATNLILGDWIYKSSATPTMLSRTAIPESIRLGLKGHPVNDLVDTPVFGETQTIIHVAELKNGQTSITMTPETVPYRGLEDPALVRKLAA